MIGLTERLKGWVADGGKLIGEMHISLGEDGYRMTHVLDLERDDLEEFSNSADARKIALYDQAGVYRPLKSAPGLRRGWVLKLADAGALREALDNLYPAALGTWFANEANRLEAVPLRDVLGRQTGMYRFANNLSDSGAQALVGAVCSAGSGCLKRVCWGLVDGQSISSLPEGELSREPATDGEMPMLCVEACNWLVAKARKASAKENDAGA